MPGESTRWGGSKDTRLFQSTPGINAGRIPVIAKRHYHDTGFNPRPALMPGESLKPGGTLVFKWFQSTPGINAGRIEQDPGKVFGIIVSIHARH